MNRPAPITKNNALFAACEKWVRETVGVFETGDRRTFLSHLAQACHLSGVSLEDAKNELKRAYLEHDNDFTTKEVFERVEAVYNSPNSGSAIFKNGKLVDKNNGSPIKTENDTGPVADVIYASEVRELAKDIYLHGYKTAESTGVTEIDYYFKWKRKELTCLSGYGNEGKSEFLRFMMLNKSVKDGTKWAIFGPEDNPAEEFYHGLAEMLVGADCTPLNPSKPPIEIYEKCYDFVGAHFFYIYPEKASPTPEYIFTRFLKLILNEKVDGCIIDPFNQLFNDYESTGGRDDKYLERFLSESIRFAVMNNVYSVIVCHPVKPKKDASGVYPCPDAYDLAGGAMWKNKCDNILIYYRPDKHLEGGTACQLHSKKIRRQKIVGKIGSYDFNYNWKTRRFIFDSIYPIKTFLDTQYEPEPVKPYGTTPIKPYTGDTRDITESKRDESDDWMYLYDNKQTD